MQQIKLNYLTDGHGDIREITDKDGTTLVKYSYDAWGNPTTVILNGTKWSEESQEGDPSASPQDDVASLNPYRYASYRYDSDTGMYYLRARYYDPVTGRFLSKDPILKESISKQISDIGKSDPFVKDIADELVADIKANHPYAYAKNNPVNLIDPWGLCVYLVRRYYVSSYQTKFNYWAAFAASTTLVWLISYYSKRTGWSVTAITSMVWPIPEPGTVLQLILLQKNWLECDCYY